MIESKKYGAYGTYALIPRPRVCDIPFCSCDAAYDTVTNHGSWANLCEKHYKTYGIGELGIGRGQKYFVVPIENC